MTPHAARVSPANRFGLDYRAEAARFGPPAAPIIDAHTHINGARAARIYDEARRLYGVAETWSMTQLSQADDVRAALGDTLRFIAVPNYMADDRRRAFRESLLEDIRAWRGHGARILKFWTAPRSRDMIDEIGEDAIGALDSPWRLRAMDLAGELGMMFMIHVGDPDTWFRTKYTDASKYGTKPQQYETFERLLDRYPTPWIAAHMGGWPEDLSFLDGLLGRHPNLHLDSSATKWMVRELSAHPREAIIDFLTRWRGRILFGSDIVTLDAHLSDDSGPRGMGEQASSSDEAFDLYASRYWALRTLWETDYDGESPIADPDLAMVEPARYDAMAAPRLRGKRVPADLLRSLYHDAAADLMRRWVAEHP